MLRELPEAQIGPKEVPEAGVIPESGAMTSDLEHTLPKRVDLVGGAIVCPACLSTSSQAS